MAGWSQSHFLQALGWATLNSFWQMALLWCIYTALNYIFSLTYYKKYQLSVIAVVAGFIWFLATFTVFYKSVSISTLPVLGQYIKGSVKVMNVFLISASVTYLSLLFFPSYRLIRNWQFVRRIKKDGLGKAGLHYRLFVQKVAHQLGIKKKVFVYLSDLVKSPVTLGYVKPVILLPVAALNNLSTQQVEAVLLHELSHIKRYDYLINLVVSIIHTLLYYNPFMSLFIKNIEQERENCCDQLVLQFGYDRVGYASALLSLEKAAAQHLLIMGARGKKYLLNRIEKIVGMEKKPGFKLNQFTGIIAALLCIVFFNSILILQEEKKTTYRSLAFNNLSNPIPYFGTEGNTPEYIPVSTNNQIQRNALAVTNPKQKAIKAELAPGIQAAGTDEEDTSVNSDLVNVAFDPVDASLTSEQKNKVKITVEATRKVISNLEWKKVENDIADVMTDEEKEKARLEYQQNMEKTLNWKNMEANLKNQYENIDWSKIDNNLSRAMVIVKMDSIQRVYNLVLAELDKAKAEVLRKSKIQNLPLPDQSVEEVRKAREEIRNRIIELKALRNKKVIRL